MKVFQELELQGPKPVLTKAIEVISQRLDNGWIRDYDKERWLKSVSEDEQYGFSCRKQLMREPADLWLLYRDNETLYVSNIIPQESDELSVEQYNLIISEFYERFAQPVAESLGLAHTLTPATKPIEALLSKETAAKLKRFARFPHKGTASFHLLDRQRWQALLVAARTEATELYPDILASWLLSEGFSLGAVHALSTEYDFFIPA
jgi:hypothetical protein